MTLPIGFLAIDRIHHRAALVGRVIDALSKQPVAGVEVVLTNGPAAWKAKLVALQQAKPRARPDRVISDASGMFRWLDLPNGAYTVAAQPTDLRYAAASGSATVSSTVVSLELALAPTTVTGIVRADKPPGPLGMARVRFIDGDDATYTAADGSFTLSPIEPGKNRVLELTAPRYKTATLTVTVQRGQTTTATPITLLLA